MSVSLKKVIALLITALMIGVLVWFLPSYVPLKEEKCSKCGHVIAQQKELIRIVKNAITKSVLKQH
jgi:hypothetical protein